VIGDGTWQEADSLQAAYLDCASKIGSSRNRVGKNRA
jgi:hypothetical protein